MPTALKSSRILLLLFALLLVWISGLALRDRGGPRLFGTEPQATDDRSDRRRLYKLTERYDQQRDLRQEPLIRQEPSILEDIELEPLRFAVPSATEVTLGSNALLFLFQDRELPLIDLKLHFAGGIDREPIERAGHLKVAMQLMERGGAGKWNAEQFAAELSRLGIRLTFFASYESWGVSLTTLSENLDAAFALLEDALLRPHMPEEELERIKRQMLAKIRARNENPARIAERKLMEILYPQLRLGYYLQKEDVKRLSRDDIALELKRRLSSYRLYATASGEIESSDIQEKLKGLLAKISAVGVTGANGQFTNGQSVDSQLAGGQPAEGSLAGAPLAESSLSVKASERILPASLRQKNRRYAEKIVLVKTVASQTAIAIGGYLPRHSHPDFYSLQAANYILGGGSFVSRLNREIRTKRGLAYYIYSYNHFGANYGRFSARCGTRNEAAHESLALMLKEIRGIGKIEKQELQLAKEAILNSLVFQFDTARKLLSQKVRFRLHRMPPDYLQKFGQKIEALRLADLDRMQSYLPVNRLYIVVAGPESLQAKLEQIGPVIIVEPEERLFATP